jgi:hypothetical protein
MSEIKNYYCRRLFMKKLTFFAMALLTLVPGCCFRTCKQECPEASIQENSCDKSTRKSWVTKTENCHNLCDEEGVEYHRKPAVRKS